MAENIAKKVHQTGTKIRRRGESEVGTVISWEIDTRTFGVKYRVEYEDATGKFIRILYDAAVLDARDPTRFGGE